MAANMIPWMVCLGWDWKMAHKPSDGSWERVLWSPKWRLCPATSMGHGGFDNQIEIRWFFGMNLKTTFQGNQKVWADLLGDQTWSRKGVPHWDIWRPGDPQGPDQTESQSVPRVQAVQVQILCLSPPRPLLWTRTSLAIHNPQIVESKPLYIQSAVQKSKLTVTKQ